MAQTGLSAKICGLSDTAAVAAAVEGGARFVGFVFYPPSPRSVSPAQAGELAQAVPVGVFRVGVFVDPEDDLLDSVFASLRLDFVQLHGSESPARATEIKARTGAGIIKAIKLAAPGDVAAAEPYRTVADWILFDAKAPKTLAGALPGGNAIAFDWRMLAEQPDLAGGLPWLLSGGLNIDNLAKAVRISGARSVDVSSGVETVPGKKDPELVRRFLALSATL
ncbi:MAG: phosphoribosylanthranilate isomerase [Proteobacteria bacterium]|nr:phosphoribosylanthranilate isomerase [Pseudomonadota bacterium]MDA1356747.1 phosphoribosylanthranilate isomerase [Pseudomonadota bacterium]